MRINLRKIDLLIREAWTKGQAGALRGAGKSSCYAWSGQVARDYFPDIRSEDVARIAKGEARLHWNAKQREIVVMALPRADASVPQPVSNMSNLDDVQDLAEKLTVEVPAIRGWRWFVVNSAIFFEPPGLRELRLAEMQELAERPEVHDVSAMYRSAPSCGVYLHAQVVK